MLDTYVWGKVKRISPEAPVPVLQVTGREERPGGAANVALNLSALGARVSIAGVVGNDQSGDTLLRQLDERQISSHSCIRSNRPTTNKTRMISGSQHLLRIDEENELDIPTQDAQRLLNSVEANLQNVTLMVLEDYDKGVLSKEMIHGLIALGNKYKIPVAADPKFKHFTHYQGIKLFKPNLKELCEGLKTDLNPLSDEDLLRATDELFAILGAENIIITLSEHGAYYRNAKGHGRTPAVRRNISDVSGAGDTVIAISALALACGMSLESATALANIGGGMVCETPGVIPVNATQLAEEALKLLCK